MATTNQPAWQTEELQEEWVDLEPEDEEDDANNYNSYGTESVSLTAPLNTHIQANSELEASDGTTHAVGTFLIREDVAHAPLVLPKTPGRHAKGAIKDFFTPLPLERMFDPPTPPDPQDVPERNTPSPPQSAIIHNDSEADGISDEIVETDMPNMHSFHGLKTSLTCQFTFQVPKDVMSRQRGFPQAQSTPNPPGHPLRAPATDPRLRLFQFQYDTYTREHLSAMVDSIAINTPSGTATTATPPGFGPHLSRVTEASVPDTSHLRSAKRIKLSPASELYGEDAGAGARITRPQGKDYVGESRFLMEKIKQAREFSTISTVASKDGVPSLRSSTTSQPGDSVAAKPNTESGMSDALSRYTFTNSTRFSDSRRPAYLSIPETYQDNSTPSSSNNATSKGASKTGYPNSSLHFRQNAMALMERIKNDMKGSKRVFSDDTDTSTVTVQLDDQSPDSPNRSALSSAVNRRKLSRDEKEGPNAGSRRTSSTTKSNSFRVKPSPRKQGSQKTSPEELDQGLANSLSQMALNTRAATNAAPVNTDRLPPQERRVPSSLAPPSHPSNRGKSNEDLNRFVSTSTTASGSTASGTTLTTGSNGQSFTRQNGPAHLRTIAPGDLPSMPERMGDMLFDKVMMKWVKNTAHATRDPDKSGVSLHDQSDDPFRDIESLHDDSRGLDAKPNTMRLEPTEGHEGRLGVVAEMSAIEERSEVEDDEERELTSFSTDASALVDIMTGVNTSGYNDADETTDSEDEEDLTVTRAVPAPVVEYESGDESFAPTNTVVHPPPAQPPIAATPQYSSLSLPRMDHPSITTPIKRAAGAPGVAATPTIRSALKSSGTPNSAMKNPRGSGSRYNTPGNQYRRSVSFSDGRHEGPIQDLDSSTATEPASRIQEYDGTAITQPSARSKRIADMMDALVNSGPLNVFSLGLSKTHVCLSFGDFCLADFDESPSKASSSGRLEDMRPLTERGLTERDLAASGPRGPGRSGVEQSSTTSSKRVFSRSQTHRPSSSNKANGTFLTECSFGVAHDRLVEVITDVQPFEPHWETLSAIDLSEKRLESVARLKEFLPRLDSLNL